MANDTNLGSALVALLLADPGHSPKQYLVLLNERRRLSPAQLKACSTRLDEILESGAESMDALAQVAAEYDDGTLKDGEGGAAAASERTPGVFDAPKDDAPKQVLMFLMERGTLSLAEVQAAARALKQYDGVDLSRADLAAVLFELGLKHALPAGWLPQDEPRSGSDPFAEDGAAARAAAGLLAGGITVEGFRAWLAAGSPESMNPLVLEAIREAENAAATPRKGILDSAQDRLDDLLLDSAGKE